MTRGAAAEDLMKERRGETFGQQGKNRGKRRDGVFMMVWRTAYGLLILGEGAWANFERPNTE